MEDQTCQHRIRSVLLVTIGNHLQLISEVNDAVRQCQAVPITITIWPLPFDELRWTTFTDSSFDTGERQRHQQGWLVCSTNKSFNRERTTPVSVLH